MGNQDICPLGAGGFSKCYLYSIYKVQNNLKNMGSPMIEKPDYGNWVSKRLIYAPAVIGLVFMGLAFLLPFLIIIAALFFAISAYFSYARYLFSPQGGNLQSQVRELVLVNLDWDGKGQVLDIGCGNAPLTIQLAKKYPEARITGIDYWGTNWEYSKSVCEKNATIEGVGDRVVFQSASASSLPFDDEVFDLAISNLTFHEVSDIKDKKEAIKEALRVVKKGGSFLFQDLFLWKPLYGEIDTLLETIRGWGIANVELINTSEAAFIPTMLKLPFMVGTIGILRGKK
jgi:SAM-dependent methyltransferase